MIHIYIFNHISLHFWEQRFMISLGVRLSFQLREVLQESDPLQIPLLLVSIYPKQEF